MYSIDGNCLVFTDLHFGIKNNAKSRLAILQNVFKEIIEYVKNNNVLNVISCGDLFHSRTMIDVNVINIAQKCVEDLAKYCKVWLICGNHDAYLKNQISVNSINIFRNTTNVVVVDLTTPISINGNNSLLIPWLGVTNGIKKESYDMIFGHFDVSTKFLILTYVKEHSNYKVTKLLQAELDALFEDLGKVGDLAGDFVDIVKVNGTVFSGHIHLRKEFMSKGRKFIIVGDPYLQNLGEIDNVCGFYVIKADNSYKFVPIKSAPVHVELKMSKVAKDIDNFDFSIVKGNIVHKTYDIDLSPLLDAKISLKINDMLPYEELIPNYDVQIEEEVQDIDDEQAKLIKKSKLEYIKKYIDNIDNKIVKEQKLDKDKLYSIMEEYYLKEASSK